MQPGIEPRSPGSLANLLPTRPMSRYLFLALNINKSNRLLDPLFIQINMHVPINFWEHINKYKKSYVKKWKIIWFCFAYQIHN